jgi:hypothetical protein
VLCDYFITSVKQLHPESLAYLKRKSMMETQRTFLAYGKGRGLLAVAPRILAVASFPLLRKGMMTSFPLLRKGKMMKEPVPLQYGGC